MEVWKLYISVLFLLIPSVRAKDTGDHQVTRLAMLLTLKECEDLVDTLSTFEESISKRLEHLAPENNQLLPRAKRAISTDKEDESKCRMVLRDWLSEYGDEVFYDRLTSALQHIGRTDVAIEVAKNINQDKSLNLKHYVEDYHKLVGSFKVPQELSETKNKNLKNKNHRLKRNDLSLELIIERTPGAQNSAGPLDGIKPMIGGVVLGFMGVPTAGLFIFWLVVGIRHRRRRLQLI